MKPSRCFASIGCRARSNPATFTVPSVGRRIPAIIRIVVVLPAPFGPSRP
jgi:hypothetical protein